MSNVKIYILFVAFFMVGNTVNASVKECENTLNEILFSKVLVTKDDKLQAWREKSKDCNENEVFIAIGKTKIYMKHGDLKNAKKTINAALKYKSKLTKYLEIYLIDIKFQEAAQAPTIDKDEFVLMVEGYEGLIAKYPDWYGGYSGLGSVYYSVGDNKNAELLLFKASESEGADAVVFRMLVLIYEQLEEYKKAIYSFDKALKLNQNLINDKEMMISASYSYMYSGDLEFSKKILTLLYQEFPDIKTDKSYLNAGKALAKLWNR